MVRDDVSGLSSSLPLIDTGERQRLSFWRHHAVAIQSDLLEITGWLGFDPTREVLTRTRAGVQAVPAGSRPPNVLFLVPPEGTRTYQNWEWCLGYLRLEQSRRWLVRQHAVEAEAELKAAEEEVEQIRLRHEGLTARLRETSKQVGGDAQGAFPPSTVGPRARIAEGLTEARENLDAFRAAERHRATLQLRLAGLRDHLVPRVYPGLWARVNAFLDLQALSVASVAGQEFRKVPRPLTGLAVRLERELEAD
jgi:hypothetical protein